MKEKAIFLAKAVTLGIPVGLISIPLHWMLRGGTSLYGLLCRFTDKLYSGVFPAASTIEAGILIEDLRKTGGNLSKEEFLKIINSYYNAGEIED